LHNKKDYYIKCFEELYQKNSSRLYAYIIRHLKDQESAKDLLQEVFIAAFENLDHLSAHPNPEGWLYLTTRRKIIDEIRKRASSPILPSSNLIVENSSAKINTPLLEILPITTSEEDYKILLLYYVEKYTLKEIAHILCISDEAASKRLIRARKRLRDSLSDEDLKI